MPRLFLSVMVLSLAACGAPEGQPKDASPMREARPALPPGASPGALAALPKPEGVARLAAAAPKPAPPLEVVRLQTAKVGKEQYFLVAVRAPEDLSLPEAPHGKWDEAGAISGFSTEGPHEADRRALTQTPRLLPLEGQATAVYFAGPRGGRPKELVFLGKRRGDKASARFALSYPVEAKPAPALAGLPKDRAAARAEVVVNWKSAKAVAPPRQQRWAILPPKEADLEGRWATAQAGWFAALELRAAGGPAGRRAEADGKKRLSHRAAQRRRGRGRHGPVRRRALLAVHRRRPPRRGRVAAAAGGAGRLRARPADRPLGEPAGHHAGRA